MIGALPSGLFGLVKPTVAPVQDVAVGGYATPPYAPQQPAEAFVYGAGGARLTPDQIAQRSKMAQGMIAGGMDTSPVGSWTQGLARVAQALVGNMQQKRLDKATAQNQSAEQQILQSVSGTGGNDAGVLAAYSSPYTSDGTREALKLQWQASHKAPAQPTEFERMVLAAGYQPGTPEYTSVMRQAVENKANPLQAVPGVDDQGNQVLRFMRPATMGGGGPASVAPAGGAQPPATLPPDFDFGGPTPKASATFR